MAQRNTTPVALTNNDIPDFRIGTQDMDRPDSSSAWPAVPYTCEKLNACKLTFTDQHFTDQGDLMYSATSESPNVQLSSVEGGIMIVGVTHTAKADDGMNGEDQEITVTVTAKDMGDLTVERDVPGQRGRRSDGRGVLGYG